MINYELPEVAEIYVHRIGRTGRAGATGIATSFCAADERDQLRQIERLMRRTLDVEQTQPVYKREAPVHDDRSYDDRPRAGGQRSGARPARPAAAKPRRPEGEMAFAGNGGPGTTRTAKPGQRPRRPAGGRKRGL